MVASSEPARPGTSASPAAQRHADMLRFMTCGSVDDGKSTLIGRLLFESGQLLEDQRAALERDSQRHGTRGIDMQFARYEIARQRLEWIIQRPHLSRCTAKIDRGAGAEQPTDAHPDPLADAYS